MSEISINIFGDFVPIERGVLEVKNKTAINQSILEIICKSDLNILNLECPIFDGKLSPINKIGRTLFAPTYTLPYLKDVGFELVTLANNHIRDYGDNGVSSTILACENNHVQYIGAGKNIDEAQKIKIIACKEKKIAFINVCENEFSIAGADFAGACPLDLPTNFSQIKYGKERADYVFVIFHGGIEFYQLPSPRMKKICRFFVTAGADAVICHHPHCFSGYEIFQNAPIFYSLGNFYFDNNKRKNGSWNEGFFFYFFLNESLSFTITPYTQCNDKATVALMNQQEIKKFEESITKLNQIILNDKKLEEEYNKFVNSRYLHYISSTITFGNLFQGLVRKNLFPLLLSKKCALFLLNNIRCESHRDLLIDSLCKYTKVK